MDFFKTIYQQLSRKTVFWRSLVLMLLLVIVFFLYYLWPLYSSVLSQLIEVIKPFLIGFMVAYILSPLVNFLEHKGLKRVLAMTIVYVGFIISILFLVGVLLPAVLNSLSELSDNIIGTAKYIERELLLLHNIDTQALMDEIIQSAKKLVENLSLVENTFNVVNVALGMITKMIIYLVISSYMLSSFDNIKLWMKRTTKSLHPYFPSYLSSLDFHMQAFLKGMMILMAIRLVEYGLVYLLIGHAYWKELSLLSALSVFVPYLGPLLSCGIGILTGFRLPTVSFVVMIILLVILFFIDSYVVLPDIYSNQINSHPVWILFSMMTGLNLFGLPGLLLSIPVFIAFRVAFLEIYFFSHESV